MTLEVHPHCELIPEMEPDAFEALKADVKKNGIKVPIWLYEGKILDGRNRYRVCQELGVKCPSIELSNGNADPLSDIVSLNVIRRHLDESQRALIAARMANVTTPGGDKKSKNHSANLQNEVTVAKAAKSMNVSPRTVEAAKTVLKEGGPGMIAAVAQGRIKVSKAARMVGRSYKTSTPRPKPSPKPKPDLVKEAALMVWYQLKRFPETGLLDHQPVDLFEKMNTNMKEDLVKLVPKIVSWLEKFPRRVK